MYTMYTEKKKDYPSIYKDLSNFENIHSTLLNFSNTTKFLKIISAKIERYPYSIQELEILANLIFNKIINEYIPKSHTKFYMSVCNGIIGKTHRDHSFINIIKSIAIRPFKAENASKLKDAKPLLFLAQMCLQCKFPMHALVYCLSLIHI